MLANGVPMKQIQEWFGYSDFSVTANVYAHLDYNSKLSSADAMANGLKGALIAIQKNQLSCGENRMKTGVFGLLT